MALIASAKDLQHVREAAMKESEARIITQHCHLILGMGTVGVALGAKETLEAIMNFIEEYNLEKVAIKQTGDIGLDSFEPILRVKITGQDQTVYCNLTPEKAVEILQEHVIKGNRLEKYIMNRQIAN